MSWNYRLCKETYRKDCADEEVGYSIREAYYNKNGGIWAITEHAIGVYGESVDDIKRCLEWMQSALEKEIIDLDVFVFEKADSDNE